VINIKLGPILHHLATIRLLQMTDNDDGQITTVP